MFLFQLPLLSKKHLLPLTAHAGDLVILFDTVLILSSHPRSMSSPSLPVPMRSWSALPALGRLGLKPLPRRSSPVLPLAKPPGPCSLFLSVPSSKSGLPTFLHTLLDSSFIALVQLGVYMDLIICIIRYRSPALDLRAHHIFNAVSLILSACTLYVFCAWGRKEVGKGDRELLCDHGLVQLLQLMGSKL